MLRDELLGYIKTNICEKYAIFYKTAFSLTTAINALMSLEECDSLVQSVLDGSEDTAM